MRKYKKPIIAMLLMATLTVAGCETMGGSAGLGALLGAGAGAMIGGTEGAAIGAGLGAGIGALAHKIKENRQIKTAEETAALHKYKESQGLKSYLDAESGVTPKNATIGQSVEARLQYAVLGAPPEGVAVHEFQTLTKQGEQVASILDAKPVRTNGTWTVAQDIGITEEVAPGTYTLSQNVSVGESSLSRQVDFVVTEKSAMILNETIHVNGRLVLASAQ